MTVFPIPTLFLLMFSQFKYTTTLLSPIIQDDPRSTLSPRETTIGSHVASIPRAVILSLFILLTVAVSLVAPALDTPLLSFMLFIRSTTPTGPVSPC